MCYPYRSTPVECLHTILLGPYKYFISTFMNRLSPQEQREVEAKLEAFPSSGLPAKLSPGSIIFNYRSLLGRDYKLIAQVCLYTFWDHFTQAEREVWKNLSKVHN